MGSNHKISDEILDRILLKIYTSELDQKTLAKKIGISPTTITDWKTGKSRSYNRPQMLALLAKELGTTTEYLLTGRESNTPPISDDAVIKPEGRHTLSADAVEVAFAYDDASPEIQAAVRRVLAIGDRSFPAKSTHPGEAM